MTKLFVLLPISAIVLGAVGCASTTGDETSASNSNAVSASTPVDTDSRCVSLSQMTDDDAQSAAADAFEKADAAAYETCRHSLAENAPTLDEFLKWATDAEIEADLVEDPTEAAPTVTTSKGTVNVSVSIAHQTATIEGGGLDFEDIKVATGRPGFATSQGCFTAFKAQADYVSHKYHAPMPYAVFFHGGEALHVGSITTRSHGCVHLTTDVAKAVFKTYEAGYTVRVCVSAD
jgi:lipoprotein-anchoring transpeptidase ErfK/SrfK